MIKEKLDNFFKNWPIDKGYATDILNENKKYNSDLKKGKVEGKSYPNNKKTFSLYDLKSANLISKSIPNLLHSKGGLPTSKYKIEGSIGKGNPAEIPWVCIFDKEISTSAQTGYYIVYLFDSKNKGVYLSFNQGWTQYGNEFGVKEGKKEVFKNASFAKKLLKGDEGFTYDPINLHATNLLGKGYELGNICSKYYPSNLVPEDEELIDDLRNLVGVYRELKGRVGADILSIRSILNEDSFQEEIQQGNRKKLKSGVIKRKNKKNDIVISTWVRDANISFTALDNANFNCEINSNHKTFISARTGRQFVEAHHLIPMEFQGQIEVSIDVPENIVSLCPNCHRAIHNSIPEIKKDLLKKLYNERKEGLYERGIEVSKVNLFSFYKSN